MPIFSSRLRSFTPLYCSTTSSAARVEAKKSSCLPLPSQSGRPAPRATKRVPATRESSHAVANEPSSSSSARASLPEWAASAKIASESTVIRASERAQAMRGEQLVVVQDDPVVDPDDRPVPNRVVVGRDRRVALRVVADVDEQLGRRLRHRDPLEQLAGGRALLRDDGIGVLGAAVGVADGVGAALGDACEQGLSRERPVDGAARGKAVAGNPAHISKAPRSRTSSVYDADLDTQVSEGFGGHRRLPCGYQARRADGR